MSSFLNKLSGGSSTNNNNGGMMGNSSNQNEDYGDKALDFIEKKTGHVLGRGTNEKITDGIRNQYEKATG
ncbi:hypothetical protein GYMLUDRAFT_175301 [Collybiopsis luxurians FD-317 M1]|uniref:Uncharacterized protein n=1 Tax=Collybiopsis luxurians FD-317 M1 TaxID=944289 RepID=A0A0D0C033_9AGAR|nr:hypothetical protein GYMLUDRAFT_175301 [Collybiopsis luxurians FD-317 M1]